METECLHVVCQSSFLVALVTLCSGHEGFIQCGWGEGFCCDFSLLTYSKRLFTVFIFQRQLFASVSQSTELTLAWLQAAPSVISAVLAPRQKRQVSYNILVSDLCASQGFEPPLMHFLGALFAEPQKASVPSLLVCFSIDSP